MNLTGKQLKEFNIITGPLGKDNIQQHGIDLNLREIIRLNHYVTENDCGYIPVEGKTRLGDRHPVEMSENVYITDGKTVIKQFWNIQPGAYEVVFDQGCRVPPDQRLRIIQRSSILRNGGILHSSVFDAGFHTDKIGTCMFFFVPIRIEVGARVAQIVAEASNVVENLYEGQWQGDKQRKINYADPALNTPFSA